MKNDNYDYICYIRFLQLLFNHICRDFVFENDELVLISKISEYSLRALRNVDKKNGLNGPCVIPPQIKQFLCENCQINIVLHQKLMLDYPLLMLWNRTLHTLSLSQVS